LEFLHEEKTTGNVLKVTLVVVRYKRAKIQIENKNAHYLNKIQPEERELMEKLAFGIEEDLSCEHDSEEQQEGKEGRS
jgi:hypothetical protein